MYVLEIGLLVAGLILLVVGYRRHHRNLLLAGAMALFLAGALGSAVDGFVDGYRQVDRV